MVQYNIHVPEKSETLNSESETMLDFARVSAGFPPLPAEAMGWAECITVPAVQIKVWQIKVS